MMWPWWWPWRLLFQSLCSCDLHSQNVFGTWKKRGKEIQMEYIQYVTDVYIYIYTSLLFALRVQRFPVLWWYAIWHTTKRKVKQLPHPTIVTKHPLSHIPEIQMMYLHPLLPSCSARTTDQSTAEDASERDWIMEREAGDSSWTSMNEATSWR